ncbi:ParA family protein [Azohydromonas australica]|uniref:ParA family protein n=1 Tax=Azohydromonas australica TaxID=364039 RepID=UPI00041364DC|nr:AAA family ATPase [Azohydromonas australica]
MTNIVVEGREQVELADIGSQAERAKKILARVRKAMLAPNATKEAPRFSPAQLGSLVNLDTRQVDYRAKKGELPGGGLNAAGTRREFQLPEVRQWARELRKLRLRPENAEAITIAVANFKGGVTKTTTAVTLAQGLSIRGHKVLVIDCDPQGSLTTLFGILPDAEVEAQHTILPLCLGEEESIEYAIRPTYWDGIDLVPATSVLFSAEFALPGRQRDEGPSFQFWNVLHYGIEQARQDYDVIIIDTPPALSYVTINAMMASDGVITPLPPNALDFASSVQFWDLFYDLTKELVSRGKTKKFEFIDVLLAKVDASDIATSVVREWISAAYGAKVLPFEIPKTSTAASASAEFGSVYDMKPGSAGSKTIKRALDAYDQFVETVESQMVGAWLRQVVAVEEAQA